jgi:hypothetical protein
MEEISDAATIHREKNYCHSFPRSESNAIHDYCPIHLFLPQLPCIGCLPIIAIHLIVPMPGKIFSVQPTTVGRLSATSSGSVKRS